MADNKRKINLVFVFIICLLLAAGFLFFRSMLRKTISGIQAIPQSSLAFIELPNTADFFDNILDENYITKALSEIPSINPSMQFFALVDSLAKTNKDLERILQSKSYLSMHRRNDSLEYLLIIQLDQYRDNGYLLNISKSIDGKNLTVSEQTISETKMLEIYNIKSHKKTYGKLYQGLILLSENPEIIQSTLAQITQDKIISDNKDFKKVEKTSGKNVDAHIYINTGKTGQIFSLLCNTKYINEILQLDNFSAWTELDLILKNDEVLLNGYTSAMDSSMSYLNTFLGQKPPKIQIPNILPYNTNMMLHFGFENFNKYYSSYEEYLRSQNLYEEYYKHIVAINNRYHINLEKDILSWIGKEVAVISLATKANKFDDNFYAILEARDPVKANQMLTKVMHNVRGSSTIKVFKNHRIKKINLPDLLSAALGPVFQPLQNPYYTQLDEYVIFANSTQALEEFINGYLSGKTLATNTNYKNFTDNISEHSNIYLYFNTRNALQLLPKFANQDLAKTIKTNSRTFANFHAFALQFSYLNNMFYTNTYLKYNSDYREENRDIWKTELDAPIIKKPFLVKDHTDQTLNIVVFDEENQMYLIDNNGRIAWKRPYIGKLMSGVFPVDYYKNRKVQYLFNTDEYIYLVDLLGRDVVNFPIKLNNKSNNGLAVFDYAGNKDYRILFAGENNKIYNYDIKGNAIKGWGKPQAREAVNKPLQHLVAKNKDYLIVSQADGSVKILNRKGKDRIKIKSEFKNAFNSDFYTNLTNSKGIIITTDKKGHLTYINKNGQLARTVFEDFSPDHFFLYADLDHKNGEDFIFLDGKDLVVYDRFKNKMFTYQFPYEIKQKPEIIRLSSQEKALGIVSEKDKKLYLFDGKGNIIFNAGLTGSTRFAVGRLSNNSDLNLLVGNGNTLYNYLIR
jgi:WD40 repeat protein